MRAKDIVRLPKTVTHEGVWKVVTGTAKMPPSAFRLSKRASYQLGRHWHWRVDELEGGGFKFRLLTAYRSDNEEYLAWLSTPIGDGLRIIARFEFHGSHPGWHCHSHCGDHEDIPVSEQAPYIFKRAPGPNSPHRKQEFVKTDYAAMQKAFSFFGVKPGPNWSLTP